MKSLIAKDDGINKKIIKAKSLINRLSENTKPEKFGVNIKGLMTRKSAKIPILGQPVNG